MVLTLVAAPMALAQGRVIDEGSLLITRNGSPVGREAFRIAVVSAAGGDLYRATAQVAYGERRITPTLNTDSSGNPVSYDVAVRDQSGPIVHLSARAVPGRLSVLEQTPHGESAKEYVVPKRLLLLDEDVFHQYYFAALSGPGTIQVIHPQARTKGSASIERGGSDRIQVAGQSLSASHYTVVCGDGDRVEVWVDGSGRLLRVTLPARGLVAQREELPR